MKQTQFYIFLFLFTLLLSCEKREFESKPGVVTGSVSEITIRSANIRGNIIDLGSGITNHGHCWGTTPQPLISNSKTSLGKIISLGEYTSELTNLEPGVSYFVRAYVSDNNETYYGKETSFTCLSGQAGLTTSAISDITINSANSGGNISDDGGAKITARGICWSTSQNPSINDSKTNDGSGTGSFTSNLTGLQPNTTYYVRTYAINSVTTSYGNQQSFTTKDGLATLTTTTVTNITANSAISGGDITDDGGAVITVRGVCWSTVQNPTINDSNTTNGIGTGSFGSNITGLQAGKTYYVRAYATTSFGTTYGNEQIFETEWGNSGTFTDSRDGKTYKWVTIGDQVWMAENLAWLPEVSPSSATSETTPYYYVYGYNGTSVSAAKETNNYKTYGALYNWPAATKSSPDGWHLPTDAEWKELEIHLGMSQSEADNEGWRGTNEGTKLKATSGWSNNGNGTNISGFTALPSGYRDYDGNFTTIGLYGFWWSATEYDSSNAWIRGLYFDEYVGRGLDGNGFGNSVRCVRD